MPDVQIKYGHPAGFQKNRDGSYSVTVSRKPKNRHPVNKTQMWEHYRQALSAAYLETIYREYPSLYRELECELSLYQREAKAFLAEAVRHSTSGAAKVMLSLQYQLWGKLPSAIVGKKPLSDFGQVDRHTQGDWRAETIKILAEVQKSNWSGLEAKQDNTRRKIKSAITKHQNRLAELSGFKGLAASLSGKRSKIIRQIMAEEAKLKAVELMDRRIAALKNNLRGY